MEISKSKDFSLNSQSTQTKPLMSDKNCHVDLQPIFPYHFPLKFSVLEWNSHVLGGKT